MKLSRYFFLLLSTLFVLGFYSCSDNDPIIDNGDDDETAGLAPHLKAVNELIKSGGKLEVTDEYENITVDVDTLKVEDAVINGFKQECYSIGITESYDINRNPDEFVLMNPWSDVIWPGGLIQGGSLRDDNVPAGVPIYKKRIPGKIYLSIVSGNETMDEWYKETELRPANVTQAMNDLMKTYLGKTTPAYTSFKIEKVHSIEEMALKLGIDLKLFGVKMKTEFGSNWKKDKNYMAVHLKQQFFTMSYEGPDGGFKGTFTDDITTDDLDAFTGKGNPLCYVSSVTYGRSYVMLYESSASTDSLHMALTVAYKNDSTVNSKTSKKILNESKCTMTQIGGNPQQGLETVFGDFDKLKAFVIDGAKVSADNVGAPISFKINQAYDNTPARLSNTLKFSFTQQTYSPVAPKNDVEINIFDIYMQAPQTNRKVSNYSNFEIKGIRVGHSETGEFTTAKGGKYHTFDNFKTGKIAHKNGATVSVYKSIVLPSVPKNHKIRLECVVRVKNHTYGGSTKVGEDTYTLIRDFEYNLTTNVWEPIAHTDIDDPKTFKALYLQNQTLSDTRFNFDLNFRFKCDNVPYPLR